MMYAPPSISQSPTSAQVRENQAHFNECAIGTDAHHGLYQQLCVSQANTAIKSSMVPTMPSPQVSSCVWPSEQSDPVLAHAQATIVGLIKQQDHCSYVVLVQTETEQFLIHKRYNDFRRFRDDLVRCSSQRLGCNRGPCRHFKNAARFHFPKKTLQLRYHFQEDLVRRRSEELNVFLAAVLTEFRSSPRRNQRQCELHHCVVFKILMHFFDLDKSEKQSDLPPQHRTGAQDLPTPALLHPCVQVLETSLPNAPLYPIMEEV